MGTRRRAVVAALAVGVAVVACSGQDAPDDAQLARGFALYEAACVRCHGGATGGAINRIPPVHNANGHTWHHGDCLLREIITDGIEQRPGVDDEQVMPAFGDQYDDEDIDALLAVMRTWWTDEQREAQRETTRVSCPTDG